MAIISRAQSPLSPEPKSFKPAQYPQVQGFGSSLNPESLALTPYPPPPPQRKSEEMQGLDQMAQGPASRPSSARLSAEGALGSTSFSPPHSHPESPIPLNFRNRALIL